MIHTLILRMSCLGQLDHHDGDYEGVDVIYFLGQEEGEYVVDISHYQRFVVQRHSIDIVCQHWECNG